MIYPLVVIYNKSCADSDTCRALQLQTCKDLPVYIFDNSTRDYGNRDYCRQHGWTYLGGSGNQGLSKAYNQAVQALLGKEGFLCLLDDDTHLPETFFAQMQAGIRALPGKRIYVPILRQGGSILSPNRADGPRKDRFFDTNEACLAAPVQDLRAFNSCMTIDLQVFADYRYDERLFLDCVDHAFLRDMRQRGYYPTVLPVTCEHGFSGKQKGSFQGAKTRFRILCGDTRVYQPEKAEKTLLRRALHLCWIYRSTEFLKIWKEGKGQ